MSKMKRYIIENQCSRPEALAHSGPAAFPTKQLFSILKMIMKYYIFYIERSWSRPGGTATESNQFKLDMTVV